MDEVEKPKSYGSGNSTGYGYIAEWRLKPESAVLATISPFAAAQVEWRQAPYSISCLGRLPSAEKDRLVRPYISDEGDLLGRSRHGLVSERVAEAIIACLKTEMQENILAHIEWQVVRVRLEQSHKLTQWVDDIEHEKHMSEIENILVGAGS